MPPYVPPFVGVLGVWYANLDRVGFPYYRVGDDGSIFTLWVRAKRGEARNPPTLGRKWLPVHIIHRGDRRFVNLRDKSGVDKSLYVHTVVLNAFVGPAPPGMEACHYPDRSPSNNNLSNLRWGTRKENAADRDDHETTARGSRNGFARYTENFVRKIRVEAATLPQYGRVKFLSKKYDVPWSTMKKMILGYGWNHVEDRVPYKKRSNGKGHCSPPP